MTINAGEMEPVTIAVTQRAAAPATEYDVYVVGDEEISNGQWVTRLWKNGVAQYTNGRLTDGTHPAQGLSVYAIDGDVYVAGLEMRDIGNDQRMESAKLWKNGVAQYGGDLGDGVNFAVARSVFVVAR